MSALTIEVTGGAEPDELHIRLVGDATVEALGRAAEATTVRLHDDCRVVVDLTEVALTPQLRTPLSLFHDELMDGAIRAAYLADRSWVRGMLLGILRGDPSAKPVATMKQARQWLQSHGDREEIASRQAKLALRRVRATGGQQQRGMAR